MAAAPPAFAASSESSSTGEFPRVSFQAAPGETNHLTISDSGSTLILEDTGATIAPGEGCTAETPSRVACTVGAGQASYTAHLDDRDDVVTVNVQPGGRFDIPDGGGEYSAIHGGDGDDTMHGSAVEDWFDGNAGDDVAEGGGAFDFLTAGPGNDRLFGGPGDDSIGDGAGEAELAPPAEDRDVMSGGSGRDTLYYAARTDPQSFTFDGVANDGVAGENDDIGSDFEELDTGASNDTIVLPAGGAEAITGAGDDDVVGGSGNDTIATGKGTDRIDGGDGADWLYGGPGGDNLVGGPGFDHIIGDDMPDDAGDDTIDARDGSVLGDRSRPADWVVCGGGVDTYLPDFADYLQIAPSDGCENVVVPPDPLHAAVPAAAATAGAKTARLSVHCPFSGGGTCDGRITLMSVGKPSRTLATGRLKIPAGGSAKVRLRLAAAARRALGRKRSLRARAIGTTATRAHETYKLGRVTLRRPRR